MEQSKKVVRARTCDVAFSYRMGAGFAGDVNRTHPAEIEAVKINTTNPPSAYGQPVVYDTTNGVRKILATEQSDTVALLPAGFTVRPYPTQQSSASNYGAATIGDATPPVSGVIDILRAGLIMGKLNVGVTAPVKGGRVYVWAAATSGNHVQGGLETEASAGNTVELDARYTYNGPADADGVVEISANV